MPFANFSFLNTLLIGDRSHECRLGQGVRTWLTEGFLQQPFSSYWWKVDCILQIFKTYSAEPDVAFLFVSAGIMSTRTSGWVNESIHIASAFLVAMGRPVIKHVWRFLIVFMKSCWLGAKLRCLWLVDSPASESYCQRTSTPAQVHSQSHIKSAIDIAGEQSAVSHLELNNDFLSAWWRYSLLSHWQVSWD